MQETKKTLIIAGVALLLGVVAFASAPRRALPDLFFDVGETFFPEFADPDAAATLDVVEFNAETASVMPFQVTNRDGLWTIPSHHDYPADGAERLSNIAADIISLTKEDFRSDNVADHEALGVIDPTDLAATSLVGRGTRLTVKDANDEALADLIVGRPVEGRPGLRFVRAPDQKRVYTARFEADISTRFEDWIEKNLLEVERDQVVHIVLNEYQVDEMTRRASRPRAFTVDKVDDTTWSGSPVPSGQEVGLRPDEPAGRRHHEPGDRRRPPEAGGDDRQPARCRDGGKHQPHRHHRPGKQGLLPHRRGRPALERR